MAITYGQLACADGEAVLEYRDSFLSKEIAVIVRCRHWMTQTVVWPLDNVSDVPEAALVSVGHGIKHQWSAEHACSCRLRDEADL